MPQRQRIGLTFLAFSLLAVPVIAQSQATQGLVRVTDETALIAQGWSALAAGDAITAADRAQTILQRFPQSVAGLSLAVEASIARQAFGGRGLRGKQERRQQSRSRQRKRHPEGGAEGVGDRRCGVA